MSKTPENSVLDDKPYGDWQTDRIEESVQAFADEFYTDIADPNIAHLRSIKWIREYLNHYESEFGSQLLSEGYSRKELAEAVSITVSGTYQRFNDEPTRERYRQMNHGAVSRNRRANSLLRELGELIR